MIHTVLVPSPFLAHRTADDWVSFPKDVPNGPWTCRWSRYETEETPDGSAVVLCYSLVETSSLASMQGYVCGFKDACPGVQWVWKRGIKDVLPFRVVIIQSSASEDRLRAAIAALGHLALPRELPAGYRGFKFRELQLLRLPTVAGAAASDHGLPEGGKPKARASADQSEG